MRANEKDDSIFAEHRQEPFEFSDPRQLPDGQIVTNVCNHSHDEPSEHVYSLFFDAERENTIVGCHAEDCACPADEHHEGPCKHRSAAAQCGELLGRVLDVALDRDDSGQDASAEAEQPDGRGSVATDGGREPSVGDTVDYDGQSWTVESIAKPLSVHEEGGTTVALRRGRRSQRVAQGDLEGRR